jgi:glycosyltransferase involved in cell wall biosynthesis
VKTKKHVLIYYPPNNRSIAIETMCKAIYEEGHKITILTLSARGAFHDTVEKMGILTSVYQFPRKPSWKFFLNNARHLIRFCRENNIDLVMSHLQEANLIAVMAQKFIKARVITFRHHDESAFYAQYGKQFGMVRNKKEVLIDRFINRFAKKIIVLSNHVLNTMKVYEKCDDRKITVCPLIYDFSKYPQPNQVVIEKIKTEMSCRLLLIMVGRMIESKQHLPVFEVVKKLKTEGMSVKMIVMDEGPLKADLENFVKEHHLSGDIIMPGYRADLINYMATADMLIHPSLTEASNNVVKEMALLEKGVAVCEGVGDFDDYITDGCNGYMMKRSNLKSSIEKVIRDAYTDPHKISQMGKKLKIEVMQRFSDTKANRDFFLKLI